MKKYLKVFQLLTLFSVLFSCTNHSLDDLTEPIPQANSITYNDHVKTIIDNNCISCHNNPPVNGAPMLLTTYDAVKEAVENRELINRIASTEPGYMMPLGGQQLPQNLIDLIIQWEADGLMEQ